MTERDVMTAEEETKAIADGITPEQIAFIKAKRLRDAEANAKKPKPAFVPPAPRVDANGFTPEQVAAVQSKRERDAYEDERIKIANIWNKVVEDEKKARQKFPDLTDSRIYDMHHKLLLEVANRITLAPQCRRFVEDEHNQTLIKFLLYYFNSCPLAESVYPNRKYKLAKSLLLMGNVGVGKTLLMQLFAEYLRRIDSPNQFYNLSVTQMVNYFTVHNNLDRFTFNIIDNPTLFDGSPVNVCLNDIGVDADPEKPHKIWGTDAKVLTEEFLHARNEIWTQYGMKAHLTTNLSKKELDVAFADKFGGRLPDRFKTYNIIILDGTSRR